jgi:putative flippase GtrA
MRNPRVSSLLEAYPRIGRCSGWLEARPLVGGVWTRILENPKEVERFIKFALVGILGAVVDFTVLNMAKRLFEYVGLGVGWDVPLDAHQIQLIAANTISFTAAVLSNFTWNRLWTFPESRDRPLGTQLAQFAVVNVLGWLINTVLLLVMDQFVFQRIFDERLSYNMAKAFATCVVLFWNFGVNRVWTYKGIE